MNECSQLHVRSSYMPWTILIPMMYCDDDDDDADAGDVIVM
jgi:hypothetical protein